MIEDLKWLIKLQHLDGKIYRLTEEERVKIKNNDNLNSDIEDLMLNKVKINRSLEVKNREKGKLLNGIEEHEKTLLQKIEDLKNDKKTKKEHIKREIKKIEEAIGVFQTKIEEIDKSIENFDSEIDSKENLILVSEKKMKTEERNIAKIKRKTKKTMAELMKEREEIIKNIRKPFLGHYDRIRKIRNGVAITYVDEKGLCFGCKIYVPVQQRKKVKQMDDYNICEGCGRILVSNDMLKIENLDKK